MALILKHPQSVFVSHEATAKRGILIIRRPIEHGIIERWDDMEVLWSHTLEKELSVSPDKQPILLTEPPFNPKENRERMAEMMFEKFQTPGIYIANTLALSLLAAGRRTGCVLEVGYGQSRVAVVRDGHLIPHTLSKLELSGQELSNYMFRLIDRAQRHWFSNAEAPGIANDVKETLSYVALDFQQEMAKPSSDIETTFTVQPFDETFTVGNERFRCPELMFNPPDFGMECSGIHEEIYNSIMKCDEDIRNELFANIVISGGSTLFPGLPERLQKEVAVLAPSGTDVKVIAEPNRKFGAWFGGSRLASSPEFREMMITKQVFDEIGASIVGLKCT